MSSNTLFVSNFPFSTSEADLRAIFETFSSVANVRIILDRQTGRSRGYAFVELEDGAALQRAIDDLNETTFSGRRLAVNEAKGRPNGEGNAESNGNGAASPRRPPFRHRIVVEWREEAHSYDAEVPALGIHGAGATPERAIRDAIFHAESAARPEGVKEDSVEALTSRAF
jgi:RNA recognition motif-containing protein